MQSAQSGAPMLVVGTAAVTSHREVRERAVTIAGFDGLDGHERWRVEMEPYNWVPPCGLAADGGLVYVATTEGLLYAIRAEDGDIAWQRQVTRRYGSQVDLRVMARGGVVSLDYARPDLSPPDRKWVTVLDGQHGSELWVSYPTGPSVWIGLRRLRYGAATADQSGFGLLGVDPAGVYVTTVNDRAPLLSDKLRTILLDGRTGRQRWSTRYAAAANYAGHWGSRTTLAAVGDIVYTVGERLSSLDSSSGRTRWSRPIPAGAGVRPGPLVANEAVVCAAYDALFQVHQASDGALLWQLTRSADQPPHGPVLGMVLMGDVVYVSCGGDGFSGFSVEARDVRAGDLLWGWPRVEASSKEGMLARGDLSWRLVGAGGILYVPGPKTLSAVRASDGEQLWQLPYGGVPALVAVPG